MTILRSPGNPRSDEKPYLRFFPSMTLGSVARLSRYFPRKISLAVGAFSFIAGFALLKFYAFREQISQNQQKKTIEKTPIQHPVQTETKHPVEPEIKQPIQPELKPIQIEKPTVPTVMQSKTARTYAQRRGQLLNAKV